MRKCISIINLKAFFLSVIILLSLFSSLHAQQTSISDYVLFGGKVIPGQSTPPSPGYGVQINSSTSIQGGTIGSYTFVTSTGNTIINGNIFSGGKIQLANSNTVSGKITAANSSSLTNTILSVGSSAKITGNIDVKGNIIIGGGTVSGKVTHPAGTTYSGPNPAGGNIIGQPSLPGLPTMPDITNFPAAGSVNITSTQTIQPGSYGNMTLGGNKIITLSGTGVYVFKSIQNSGGSNNFVFDFKNNATGTIKIYVHGDVDLGKVQASIVNGGSASRIYSETHGDGGTCSDRSTAWIIANGSSGKNSKWLGSVWAPYGAISIGSGTGSSDLTGALWSGTQVNIQSGVTVNFAPFIFCTPPNANAGPDKALDFVNQTTLTGSSSTNGVTYSWSAINGGVITSPVNVAQITVSSAGTYILTVSNGGSCSSKDTALVTGKVNDIIGSELQSVLQNFDPNAPESPFFKITNDSIVIDIITKEGKYAEALTLLQTPAYGLRNILSNGSSNFIITGTFPIAKLPLLNTQASLIVYCRPYYGAFHNGGIITSAGDTSVRAQLVRNGYGLQGDGIKVGVISDSYNTISSATTNPITNTAIQDIGNGDLPGSTNPSGFTKPVQVIKDYPFRGSDEGRGMLQIVHDVAPAAELYFRTGFISAGDFALGIQELKQAGCNVIVDDITFITEPFLQDGVVAKAVDQVATEGTTYFSAAGNFSNKSYENNFNPIALPGGQPGTGHNFGGGDMFQSVTLSPGNYTIVLQWLDDIYSLGQTSAGGTKNDLDIYLTPSTDGSALFGFNRNNTNGDPIEILPFTITSPVTTNIFIRNNTLTTNPARFKYIVFRGDIVFNEYATGTSTIIGQANAAGAIAVGAARFDKVSPYPGPLTVESFSSNGGTTINGVKRNKPELVAPDGVNTTVNLGIDYDQDNYSNFFGTSAAAPHAAAVAALIMEGKKKFANQPVTSPAEIRSLLQSTATDMNTPGFDFTSGYGFINVDSAMRTFAKPDPSLIKLVVPQNVTPGQSAFTLTVTGLNLSSNSVVKFRDSTLGTTILNSTTGTAVVPAFVGDPIISVYTPPGSTSGLDGGTSEVLKFFNAPKKNVVVIANNKTKKYAQQLPELTATILVNGDTLKNTNLTITDLGLERLTLTTSATSGSDVGTYAINATRNFDPTNPLDVGLQELYSYTFNQGSISIEKLPITVTAQNNTVTYGEKIPDVQFTYTFDGTNILDSIAFLNSIRSAHQSQLAKDAQGKDILGLVNGQAVTIVNGQAIPIVNGQAVTIVNGQAVTIVNGQAIPIVNGQAITIVNGQAVTIVNNLTQAQVQNLSFLVTAPSLQNARQITQKNLVNGTYQQEITKVVDITQESILDFITNSAQTYMLSSVSQASEKGLVDIESIANGQAVTIVNGQAVTIVNGQAVTIVNGQAVTIVNGQAVTIVNGQAIPIVNAQNKTAVVVDASEIGQGQSQLKSLNMVTGFDVGNQSIIPGSLLNSNLQITALVGTLTVLPAAVTITPAAGLTKVYGSADPAFTYTNNAGLAADAFKGSLGRVSGSNVGTYAYTLGDLSAGANYNLTLSTAAPVPSFAITAKPVIITPNPGQSKIYGDVDPVFGYTNNYPVPAFTGLLGRVSGQNAGIYAYTLGTLSAGTNFTLTLAAANTFTINKAPLTVKASDKFIVEGNSLPAFTSVITGLKNGDNPSVSYTVAPAYCGFSGEYAIKPSLSSFANAANYSISYVNGVLYVNPYGFCTYKLRPRLDCVEEVLNPQPGQPKYIAHFICVNDNNTSIYVPVGADNNVTSKGGSFNTSGQPVVFKPGSTRFDVPFDGTKITWLVKSYDWYLKLSVTADASSSSPKCSASRLITSATTTEMMQLNTELQAEIAKESRLSVYPNPAVNSVIINAEAETLNERDLSLFNVKGELSRVKVIRKISSHSIELDVSGLPAGFYVIKCKIANGYKTFRFVKG